MDTKKIADISYLANRLIELDGEISKINSFANQAANDQCSVQLNLKLLNMTEAKAQLGKVDVDEDGSLVPAYLMGGVMGFVPGIGNVAFHNSQKSSKKVGHHFEQKLNEIATLKVLGVLLEVKLVERGAIIEELKTLNIQIS